MAKCEDIGGAVIQTIPADQIDDHVEETVMAVETDGPRLSILVSRHRPRGKKVA